MNIKSINLNSNDINLLKFLARFKMMYANDAIYFYNSTYYQKRLQELKNANYIIRYYRIYIKLSQAGIRYLESQGIKCECPCRNKDYIDRLVFISKFGLELINTNIDFKLSWEMKENNYTDWSRRFLGFIKLKNEKYLIYYAKSDAKYVRRMIFDINKDFEYQNVLIFADDLDIIRNKERFVFPNKSSCLLVNKDNMDFLSKLEKINIKNYIEKVYNQVAKRCDIVSADYKVDCVNIIFMPFIDTHKITSLNSFYQLGMTDSKLEILTLKGNEKYLKELLTDEVLNYTNIKEIQEEYIETI